MDIKLGVMCKTARQPLGLGREVQKKSDKFIMETPSDHAIKQYKISRLAVFPCSVRITPKTDGVPPWRYPLTLHEYSVGRNWRGLGYMNPTGRSDPTNSPRTDYLQRKADEAEFNEVFEFYDEMVAQGELVALD